MKTVANGLRTRTIAGLLNFMPYVFQPNQSRGLNATFHFKFTGAEQREATIAIKNRTIDIQYGFVGKADLRVTADAKTWLGFLAREKSLPLALVTRKIRIKGDPRLLLAFGKCFPSPGPRHKQVEIAPTAIAAHGRSGALSLERSGARKNPAARKLVLAETVDVTHNVMTFRFKSRTERKSRSTICPGNS